MHKATTSGYNIHYYDIVANKWRWYCVFFLLINYDGISVWR